MTRHGYDETDGVIVGGDFVVYEYEYNGLPARRVIYRSTEEADADAASWMARKSRDAQLLRHAPPTYTRTA